MDPNVLRDIFLTESDELISDLEHGLVTLESTPGDTDAIHRIFRAAHTLKSNAGMVGMDSLVRFAHVAENVLSRVRSNEIPIELPLVNVLFRSVDVLKGLLAAAAATAELDKIVLDGAAEQTLKALTPYLSPSTGAATNRQHEGTRGLKLLQIDLSFAPDIFATGQDPAFLITDLEELGQVLSVRANTKHLPSLASMNPEECYLDWRILLRTEEPRASVENVFLFVMDRSKLRIEDVTATHCHLDDLAESPLGELLVDEGLVSKADVAKALDQQKAQQKRIGQVLVEMNATDATAVDRALRKQQVARQIRRSTSIRVDTEKLDRLVNLVGELAVSIAQANQLSRQPNATQAVRIQAVETLEQIGRDLQSQVMSVRMVAIAETFSRFKRLTRDLAQELGKHVFLETLGDETELDKNVSEQLADPLKHMVRNAVAHGLESPADRIQAGKSDTGRILLRAQQCQGYVVIEISDDGRGIDPDRVLAKALERGLIGERDHLTERQIYDLLFLPGFSTAQEVNEISGRGVGLDVVRKNVADLHGSIEVESALGKGTTFRIKLPLTLAIIEGMNVRVGPDTMTIPLSSVIELLSSNNTQVNTFEGKGELVDVRGEYLPMVRLSGIFESASCDASTADPVIVVVESGNRRFGVMVDRVLGLEQTVVKPLRQAFSVVSSLDHNYRKLEAVSGATILGDGNIALILDIAGVERMAFGALQ